MYNFILSFFLRLFYNKYFIYFLNYFAVQNIITIALLPIYSSWGNSFSTLSLVGNLIFSPLLVLYLILSIIILISFCFQKWLVSIISFQKYLIDFWVYLLYKVSIFVPYWIFTFVDSPKLSYPLCWGIILIILFYKNIIGNIYYMALYSFIGLIVSIAILNSIKINKNYFFIEDFNKIYEIKYIDKNLIFIHILGQKRQFISEKTLEYLIVPKIKKYFGINRPEILSL